MGMLSQDLVVSRATYHLAATSHVTSLTRGSEQAGISAGCTRRRTSSSGLHQNRQSDLLQWPSPQPAVSSCVSISLSQNKSDISKVSTKYFGVKKKRTQCQDWLRTILYTLFTPRRRHSRFQCCWEHTLCIIFSFESLSAWLQKAVTDGRPMGIH